LIPTTSDPSSLPPSTPAAALVEALMVRVAAVHHMGLRTLKCLPKGGQRRQIHDDVCVTVVQFDWRGGEGVREG